MQSKDFKNGGYSLIEVLVVIGITVLLSGMVLVYNRSSEKQLSLYRDQTLIIGLLNRAKALSAQKFNPTPGSSGVPCAFGLHFNESSNNFVLFQDLSSGDCETPRVSGFDGDDTPEFLERFVLDSRLEFLGIPEGGFDVMFNSPDLNLSTTFPSGFPVTITIQVVGDTTQASITIYSAGQIST